MGAGLECAQQRPHELYVAEKWPEMKSKDKRREQTSFILTSWKLEGGRLRRPEKFVSKMSQLLSSQQITLNTTITSGLRSPSSVAEYKHPVLAQSLLSSVGLLEKSLLREEVPGPLSCHSKPSSLQLPAG